MVLVTRLDLDHRGLAFRDTGGESEGREDTGFKGRQENGEQDHRLPVLDTRSRGDGEGFRDTF